MEISIQKNDIPLERPFAYFLDTLHSLPYAEVIIRTADGLVGKGEVACALDINGESQESSLALAPYLNEIARDIDVKEVQDVEEALRRFDLHLAFNRGTRCGVEQALFSIVAERTGRSLAQLLDVSTRAIRVQCTVPYLDSAKAYEERIDEILSKSPEHVKFKVGRESESELEAMRYLRRQSETTHISVDANQAFPDAEHAARFLAKTDSINLSWAEQPIAKGNIEEWTKLKKQTSVPLMVDEGLHTPEDALLYFELGLADYINLKLAKCGGIVEGRKILAAAQVHNIPVMLGSMLHGETGYRYNLTFGLCHPFVGYDFYSYFSLSNRSTPALIDPETLLVSEHTFL